MSTLSCNTVGSKICCRRQKADSTSWKKKQNQETFGDVLSNSDTINIHRKNSYTPMKTITKRYRNATHL